MDHGFPFIDVRLQLVAQRSDETDGIGSVQPLSKAPETIRRLGRPSSKDELIVLDGHAESVPCHDAQSSPGFARNGDLELAADLHA
jgi:hypothetical protein